MRGDVGRCEPELHAGGGDPRLGGFDVLGGGGLLGAQALGFAAGLCRNVLELRGLGFGRGLFGPGPAGAAYRAERPRAAPARSPPASKGNRD